ncbi:MAG: hypothetical protein ACJ8AT_17125 [Hyalangium sp.]|uniref:hypothetical protein n=1 Tax=Hyalangium sp. TaxID=2028555 RepID=UPI003899FA78
MKVDDHPEPARSTPAPGQFQQVLQRAGAPASSPYAPTAPRPPAPPARARPLPPPPPPSRSAPPTPKSPLPLPLGTCRSPGAAFASGPVLSTSRSALASPENLGLARQAMHQESSRLGTVRSEAQTTTQEKTEHRLSELISRELAREFRAEPPPSLSSRGAPGPLEASREAAPAEGLPAVGESRLAAGGAGPAPTEALNPQAKVQATLQLIEKIEFFIQSQRPALRMSLGYPLSAMVEVERTGPREVALRIQGRHGPLAQEDLARIRDALGARGLRLKSLRAE